jgi:hypothetical protein
MSSSLFANKKMIIGLWLLGMLGVLSMLPAIPQLLAAQPQSPKIPLVLIQFIAALQTGVFIFGAVLLGKKFAHRVNLSAPVINAILDRKPIRAQVKSQFFPALLGGIIGGVLILVIARYFYPFLPEEFLLAAKKLAMPWYARIFYGGITEEILLRWGLMSFLVWLCFKIIQRGKGDVHNSNYFVGVIVAAFVFGLGHLPTAYALSSIVTQQLNAYIIIGNMSFGLIAGFLYWKHGLECAIFSHMVAHLTMIIGEPFFLPA